MSFTKEWLVRVDGLGKTYTTGWHANKTDLDRALCTILTGKLTDPTPNPWGVIQLKVLQRESRPVHGVVYADRACYRTTLTYLDPVIAKREAVRIALEADPILQHFEVVTEYAQSGGGS